MSFQGCQVTNITGFPLTLSQPLNSSWPATTDAQKQLTNITVPIDFSVNWSNSSSLPLTVILNTSVFQVTGLSTVANGTTLTYGSATYRCSEIISIVQVQHRNFSSDSTAGYEAILAFQITNKSQNPSSPDIILMCRPIVFSTSADITTPPFWSTVNTGALNPGVAQPPVKCDLSTIYGYDSTTLLPMVTYQTCLPVKLFNYASNWPQNTKSGSVLIRVNIVTQPIYIKVDPKVIASCSSITKYTLVTDPRRVIDVFPDMPLGAGSVFQFKDGLGPEGFPVTSSTPGTQASNNFQPLAPSSSISAFADVIKKIEIQVPPSLLGQSLTTISKATLPPSKPATKKAFQCYRINPDKDIVGDQIMVDPTTGKPLTDTMKAEQVAASGLDPSLLDLNAPTVSSGLMPGDVEEILSIVFIVIGSIILLLYAFYIGNLVYFRNEFQSGIAWYYHLIIFSVILLAVILTGIFMPHE